MLEKFRNFMIESANIMFDDTKNDLRSLPKAVRLQILIVLSFVWSTVFSLYVFSMTSFIFGWAGVVMGHIGLIIAVYLTFKFFHKKQEQPVSVFQSGNYNPAKISEILLNNLCDKDYIIWLGHQSNIKKIYDNADIVCLPSYREGLPKSIVEAMAMSCPIITTDAVGCRECVDDSVNGFLVPVGDSRILSEKIELLLLNKELRFKMGQMSRKKMISEMSLKNVIKETFKFYDK